MSDENYLESFDHLLQVVNKIQKIIITKEFTPSLCHALLFKKVSSLLLGSCGYPTPVQVQKLKQKLSDFFEDYTLLSNEKLSQKLKTLIEIAPMASYKELNGLIGEIDSTVKKEKSCKSLLFGLIDKGELFLL